MTAPLRVYWLGGVPGSGKSIVASILAERYGLIIHRRDDYIASHRDRARPETEPLSFQRLPTGGPTVAEKLLEPADAYADFMEALSRPNRLHIRATDLDRGQPIAS